MKNVLLVVSGVKVPEILDLRVKKEIRVKRATLRQFQLVLLVSLTFRSC